jgi:Na+-transporting methylmalonyl-CoA/oxaloacetate decarboxylase gamma subunit
MFGLEILDVVIGLMFVYLLLSLLATAINEYISAVLNRRGKELARGIGRLLDDLEAPQALEHAFKGVRARAAKDSPAGPAAAAPRSVTERFYDHPLIRPLATRRGRLFDPFNLTPRLPSYIPARTFGLALLDVLGYREPTASDPAPEPGSREAALVGIMQLLKRESPLDLSELKSMLEKASIPDEAVAGILVASTGAQTRLQQLHDGVEVWFNNAMDRVSGAYKRNVQGWLLSIGVVIAFAMNADTIQMWRQLAANDDLAKAMAERAAATLPLLDSAVHRTPGTQPSVDSASARYQSARARLDSMELKLGWTRSEARRIGIAKADPTSTGPAPAMWARNPTFWGKLVGLFLTGIAISLGAPFWFDLLNKVISIRSAGRSPEEKPKSPQGPPKRAAEETPK